MPANEAKPAGPAAWGSGDSWTQGGSACFVSRRGLIPHPSFCPFSSRQHQSWEAVSGSPIATGKCGVRRVKGRLAICRPLLQIPGSPHTCIPRLPTACLRRQVKSCCQDSCAHAGGQAGLLEMRRHGSTTRHDRQSAHTHTHTIRQSDNQTIRCTGRR